MISVAYHFLLDHALAEEVAQIVSALAIQSGSVRLDKIKDLGIFRTLPNSALHVDYTKGRCPLNGPHPHFGYLIGFNPKSFEIF
jgi:hypothetical protein